MSETDFQQLKESVVSNLRDNLPAHLSYHDYKHTLRVLGAAEFIAGKEHISGRELMLIKVSALLHDIGFLNISKNHEEEGCRIARELLAGYDITETELSQICGMIMATKIPQQANNPSEEVLADADLEYLGTDDFEEVGEGLYQEMRYSNHTLTRTEFNEIQIRFLEAHNYFTTYARQHLDPVKQQHLEALKRQSH
jgi:uncharacterized protein